MALPPVLGQDTDSDAGADWLIVNVITICFILASMIFFLKGNVADSDSLASFLSGHMQDNELEVCFQIY